MFLNALTLFWVLTSIVILLTHMLLSWTMDFGVLARIVNLLRMIFLFGKLKLKRRNDEANATLHVKQTSGGISQYDKFAVATLIPKSWFTHFYLVGAVVHFTTFSLLIFVLLGNPVPYIMKNITNWIHLGISQNSLDKNAWPLLIVFTLELVQILRRLFECVFISSFSKSTMSVVHYFYGMFLYSSFGIGLLSSVNVQQLVFAYPSATEIVCYFLGLCLFLWGTYYQHKSMLTFASLRRDKKDHKQDDHYIPHGHLFEWVSCPHYLCEIVIYLAFCIIFKFSNIYMLSVALFVWINQVCSSVLVHKWYLENFSNYPVARRAIIPYIL